MTVGAKGLQIGAARETENGRTWAGITLKRGDKPAFGFKFERRF